MDPNLIAVLNLIPGSEPREAPLMGRDSVVSVP